MRTKRPLWAPWIEGGRTFYSSPFKWMLMCADVTLYWLAVSCASWATVSIELFLRIISNYVTESVEFFGLNFEKDAVYLYFYLQKRIRWLPIFTYFPQECKRWWSVCYWRTSMERSAAATVVFESLWCAVSVLTHFVCSPPSHLLGTSTQPVPEFFLGGKTAEAWSSPHIYI